MPLYLNYRGFTKLNMSTQGNRIKKIREELRLTQEQFANVFGFNRAFISAIEKDKSKLSVDNLVKLLLTYNVNMNYVLGGIGEMFNAPQTEQARSELAQLVSVLVDERLKDKGVI